MKACRICGVVKALTEFHRAKDMRDGHRNECKPCYSEISARRYQADPEAAKARVRRWQEENPERFRAYQQARRERPEQKAKERAGHLRRKFGITPEQYEAMFEAQAGGCAVCGRAPRKGSSLHVDHDHETGAVRGLLCFSCNVDHDHLRDDGDRITALAAYRTAHDPEAGEMAELTLARLAALQA